MTELEKLMKWVGESNEERHLKIEFQVLERHYPHDEEMPEDERWFRVSAFEIEQHANGEGEGDEAGYASIERVVTFEHRDMQSACAYVRVELGGCPVTAAPYAIGSDRWPGLSKLTEECGETLQIVGKLIAIQGEADHWDGTNLHDRLVEELADLQAAITFVICSNDTMLDRRNEIEHRTREKLDQFWQWQIEHEGAAS